MPGQSTVARSWTLRAHFGDDHFSLAMDELWFALYRGNPAAGGVEPDGTGAYTRVSKDNDATLWGTLTSSSLSVSNVGSAGAIVWPSSTGVYSITDPLNWWGIHTLSAGGSLRYWGELQNPIVVDAAGDIPRIPAGSLTILQPE